MNVDSKWEQGTKEMRVHVCVREKREKRVGVGSGQCLGRI